MPFTNEGKALMLEALRTGIAEISLHTADPSTTGANEVTGGSPAYARAAVTAVDFAAVSAGAFTLAADISFSGPASGACTHVGIWDGANFLGGAAITGDQAFNAEGAYVLQAATEFNLNG